MTGLARVALSESQIWLAPEGKDENCALTTCEYYPKKVGCTKMRLVGEALIPGGRAVSGLASFSEEAPCGHPVQVNID